MEVSGDRQDAVLVISVWREPDCHPSFRGRVLAGSSDEELPEAGPVTSHAEILDAVAAWLRRRMPED
ncbi:hypothetical protein [Actinomycetospora chibensis]|uniref:Type II toxin-antitoxin system HicB family antitoxin n=1 Tax=Actinomycetospora chibensis TaxID=663606 RepID=A0ABV9RLZ9_9PSEU|nr:hypothetical protein [Actinomycetospora chibensis]MDD7926976.1 hypothetical protein [Actinomycetospora chibensis]